MREWVAWWVVVPKYRIPWVWGIGYRQYLGAMGLICKLNPFFYLFLPWFITLNVLQNFEKSIKNCSTYPLYSFFVWLPTKKKSALRHHFHHYILVIYNINNIVVFFGYTYRKFGFIVMILLSGFFSSIYPSFYSYNIFEWMKKKHLAY